MTPTQLHSLQVAPEAALEVLWGDAGDAQRELLRAVPVLVDADGVVVAGAQPLPPQLLPRLDGALDDVVPREGGRARNRGNLLGRWEYFFRVANAHDHDQIF